MLESVGAKQLDAGRSGWKRGGEGNEIGLFEIYGFTDGMRTFVQFRKSMSELQR